MVKLLEKFENNQLPSLETDRLILRARTLDDLEDIYAYASLPEVTYPAVFPPVTSLEDERHYLEAIYPENLKKENLPSGYGITLKGQNKVIGSVDFNHRHADDVCEIGYLLHPDYWGQGIVPEAVSALLEIGFTLLNLHKIELGCYDYNKQSQAVARKTGFTLEATIRDRKDVRGNRCGDLRYGLLKSEWETSHGKF
ncbi:GNAT family N-acetyltransferase [Streptococcus iniae]|uniref:GNAT family N-acetyltransferase n=1 Tax=Streptococcus iniae TaxID=1346 RepID=UPI000EF6E440|nr:GNAT family protein [Streptococcus iniae]RLV20023.1 GNAT family N-acetyltransferase [Streptococcus iniae]